ncbi:MAG TPA: M23 family metallopeptidase [Ktedonobacterales bacterium]|nr:M23 family metallopeptidase [Ktedonobacterales bacterium]
MTTPDPSPNTPNAERTFPTITNPATSRQPRKRRLGIWLMLGALFTAILLSAGGYFAYTHFFAISVTWGTSTAGFSSQDQQQIGGAIQSSLAGAPTGHTFTIIDAQRELGWVILSLNEQASTSAAPIATEPMFFAAHQTGTSWDVWSAGSTNFCAELQSLPTTLLDDFDKHYFLGCYPSLAATTPLYAPVMDGMAGAAARQFATAALVSHESLTSGSFHLPVQPGVSVYVSQGNNDLLHDHNDKTGERYAFDFTVGQQNFTITAAQGGRVIGASDRSNIQCDQLDHESAPEFTQLNRCWAYANFVLIADTDGTTAQLYMHLLPGSLLVHAGDTVTQGQPIARAGTTGWSTGVHLHFQVEPVPTPQADPATGWWFRSTLPVAFDDPAVLAKDPDGVPLEGQPFTEGGSPSVQATPTPSPTSTLTPIPPTNTPTPVPPTNTPGSTIIPGGLWISPGDGQTITDTIHFAAQAYPTHPDDPAIAYVNFTLESNGSWQIACAVQSYQASGDVFSCDVSLSSLGIATGQIKVSFDVYDLAGNVNHAPNGVHTLTYV